MAQRGRLKAWYSISDLVDLTGQDRFKVRRLLKSSGVEVAKSGRLDIVYLAALKRALPDLWDSVLDRQAANDRDGEDYDP